MNNWGTNKVIEKEEVKENVNPIIFKSLKDAKVNRGIKILSYGNFGTGKTHFSLSSDSPIYILDTENGASPLADKFPEAKVLSISNMSKDFDVEEKDEVQNFQNFIDAVDYIYNLPDEEVGTVIIDSVTDIWDWAQAYTKVKVFKMNIEDRLKQQFDWGAINKAYLKPIMKLINKNCNLVLTAREGEIYEGAGKPSGRFEPKCQKKTPFYVDIVLYHQKKFVNKKIQYECIVDKCRQKGDIVGKIIVEPTLDKIKEMLK
jgi:hypothetical protein